MLKKMISELKVKVEKAKQDLLQELNNKYSSSAVHIGELSNEYVVLLSQLEILYELEYEMEE